MLRLVSRQQQRRLAAAAASSSSLRSSAAAARASLHTSSALQALSKFAMPAMSPTMTEGGIATWKKAEGDKFAPGDVLLEIETDKATMDVEAQEDGVLAKILVQEGAKNVQVGSAIAITAEEAEEINDADLEKAVKEAQSEPSAGNEGREDDSTKQSSPPKEEKKQEQKQPEQPKQQEKPSTPPPSSSSSSSQPSGSREVIFASPVAKRLALEKGIPLSQIKGTGPNGRIIKADIDSYKPSASAAAASPSAQAGASSKSAAPAEGATPAKYEDVPASNMRKVIASRLLESKQTVPHYYLTAEINMDRVMKLRELFNKAASASDKGSKDGVKAGTKLSVNDFVVKASAIALQDVPEANSSWMGDFIRQYKTQDISIAVATPNGLITPIITDVGSKGLASISSEIKSLAGKARDNKLKPHEYQGGSFSISNLGMYGIHEFQAIINPPQSCILAVGATEQKVVVDETSEKGFKVINVMRVSLSADHRTVDGAVGARWMAAFKEALENPLTFML